MAASARSCTRNGARCASTVVTMARQASPRSKSSGRTAGSDVRRRDRTRLTRKVRSPASVWATRYQVLFLTTSPSGCTVRDEARPSRPR